MKNHKHLIRLIILTAALVACGAFAFKYLRTYKNIDRAYQGEQVQDTREEQSSADVSDVVIQRARSSASSAAATSTTCVVSGSCSSTMKCCSPNICSGGVCLPASKSNNCNTTGTCPSNCSATGAC